MNKEEQKKLLIEMMEADEKDGLYETNNMEQQTNFIETGTSPIPVEPPPFTITFAWKNKSTIVTLKNGEDVLKLADIFRNILSENGIESTVKTSELKFQ